MFSLVRFSKQAVGQTLPVDGQFHCAEIAYLKVPETIQGREGTSLLEHSRKRTHPPGCDEATAPLPSRDERSPAGAAVLGTRCARRLERLVQADESVSGRAFPSGGGRQPSPDPAQPNDLAPSTAVGRMLVGHGVLESAWTRWLLEAAPGGYRDNARKVRQRHLHSASSVTTI